MVQAQLRSESADSSEASEPVPPHFASMTQPETRISPPGGWPSLGIAELWRYRDLVFYFTLRNVKVRYKQTVLGVLWAVLQPVLMMVVFVFAFQRAGVNPAGANGANSLPYPVFVLSGLLPWIFFQTAVTSAANSVVGSEGLVTKVFFPRLAIPLSAVAAALIDLVVAFVVLVGVMLWYGTRPTPALVLLPAAVLLLTMAALGIGTLIAALTVWYRDFRHAINFGMQVWMLATFTIYNPLADMAGNLRWLSRLNPMTAPIDFFRATTIGLPIAWSSVATAVIVQSALCLVGIIYFRRVEDTFADVI